MRETMDTQPLLKLAPTSEVTGSSPRFLALMNLLSDAVSGLIVFGGKDGLKLAVDIKRRARSEVGVCLLHQYHRLPAYP
jgi:hypothetical protein